MWGVNPHRDITFYSKGAIPNATPSNNFYSSTLSKLGGRVVKIYNPLVELGRPHYYVAIWKGVIYIFDILLIAGLACIVSGFFMIGIIQGVFAVGVGLIIMAVLVADAHTITYEIETEDKEDEDS